MNEISLILLGIELQRHFNTQPNPSISPVEDTKTRQILIPIPKFLPAKIDNSSVGQSTLDYETVEIEDLFFREGGKTRMLQAGYSRQANILFVRLNGDLL